MHMDNANLAMNDFTLALEMDPSFSDAHYLKVRQMYLNLLKETQGFTVELLRAQVNKAIEMGRDKARPWLLKIQVTVLEEMKVVQEIDAEERKGILRDVYGTYGKHLESLRESIVDYSN